GRGDEPARSGEPAARGPRRPAARRLRLRLRGDRARHRRPLAAARRHPRGPRRRRGGAARRRHCRVVAPRPAASARPSVAALPRPARARIRRSRGCRAWLRARARPDGGAEQLGLAHLPPDARGVLGAAPRRLLGAERADQPHQRVPAARRAAGALPVRRQRLRCALRTAAVPRRACGDARDLRRRTPPRTRRTRLELCRRPLRHVRRRRARGDDRAERPRRGVAARRRRRLPARAARERSRARGGGGRARGRRQADDGARRAGAAPPRGPARAARARALRRRRRPRVRRLQPLELRPQRRRDRPPHLAQRGAARPVGVAVVPRQRLDGGPGRLSRHRPAGDLERHDVGVRRRSRCRRRRRRRRAPALARRGSGARTARARPRRRGRAARARAGRSPAGEPGRRDRRDVLLDRQPAPVRGLRRLRAARAAPARRAGLRRRPVRARARRRALALALPVFIVLLACEVQYYDFLTRFVIVPAALTVPLLAALFRRAEVAAAVLAVAAASVGLALVHDLVKPLDSRYGHPWQLSLADAVRLNWMPAAGEALAELDQDAAGASLGGVLGPDEPSYLLFGAGRRRQVRFLSPLPRHAVAAATAAALPFVVVGGVPGVADAFRRAGWRLQPLGNYWNLAIRA